MLAAQESDLRESHSRPPFHTRMHVFSPVCTVYTVRTVYTAHVCGPVYTAYTVYTVQPCVHRVYLLAQVLVLGWMHFVEGLPLEGLRLKQMVPSPEKEGVQVAFAHVQWLASERQVAPSTELTVVRVIIQVAKFLYWRQSESKPAEGDRTYQDIKAINGLRALANDTKAAINGLRALANDTWRRCGWRGRWRTCSASGSSGASFSPRATTSNWSVRRAPAPV
eukprot:1178343-Prorocentrum_minimum.AAC.7